MRLVVYLPFHAVQKQMQSPGPAFRDQVIHYLRAGYSPEQIAGILVVH